MPFRWDEVVTKRALVAVVNMVSFLLNVISRLACINNFDMFAMRH